MCGPFGKLDCVLRSFPQARTAAPHSKPRVSPNCSRCGSMHAREEGAPPGKAGAGHLPCGSAGARRRAARSGRLRGRTGGRRGRSRRRLRLRRGRRPGRSRRRTSPSWSGPRRIRPGRAAGASMSGRPQFAVEPWSVRETRLDLDALARTESMFALANGHIGLRGNLDEGEPFGMPGTYLNSVYELRPLPSRGVRIRLPGVRADGRQRHQRQNHAAVRRRRALRPPLRRAPQPRA